MRSSRSYRTRTGQPWRLSPTYANRVRGQRYLDPPQYVRSLAQAVTARGGDVREGIVVDDVREFHARLAASQVDGVARTSHLGRLRGMALPVARTRDEAHLYMDMRPCPKCGKSDVHWDSALTSDEGAPAYEADEAITSVGEE